uniref:Protein Wnt n=1 Tax=Schistocephalus solidus TaxID=70667 RepID=A0A183SXQ2_SCHSO
LTDASLPPLQSPSASAPAHGSYEAYYNQPSSSDRSAYAPRQASSGRFYRESPSAQVPNRDSLRFYRPSGSHDVRAELSPPLYSVVGSASDALKLESSAFGFLSSEEASDTVCHSLPGLSDQQRSLCLRNPGLVWAIVDGTQLGLYECVHQFRLDRWNCSAAKIIYFSQSAASSGIATYKSPSTMPSASGSLVSGLQGILKRGSRETAFVSAAWAAGAVQAITRACSRGRISTCDCDPMRREGKSKDADGDFTWGGCSDPIRFGMRLTRLFLDSADLDLRDRIIQRERDLTYQARIRRVRGSDIRRPLMRMSRVAVTQNGDNNITVREGTQVHQPPEISLQDMQEKLRKARMIKARILMDLHNRKAGRRVRSLFRSKQSPDIL